MHASLLVPFKFLVGSVVTTLILLFVNLFLGIHSGFHVNKQAIVEEKVMYIITQTIQRFYS